MHAPNILDFSASTAAREWRAGLAAGRSEHLWRECGDGWVGVAGIQEAGDCQLVTIVCHSTA